MKKKVNSVAEYDCYKLCFTSKVSYSNISCQTETSKFLVVNLYDVCTAKVTPFFPGKSLNHPCALQTLSTPYAQNALQLQIEHDCFQS